MEIKDLPVLTIREIDPGGCVLRGNVDRWQWVGERHFGVLYLGDGRLLGGRFKDVQERHRRVAFVPDAPGEAVGIKPGAPLPYFDGYWGERAILALDPRIQWRAVEFEAHDATMHHSD